jgi:putative phosphoribosyl transferase
MFANRYDAGLKLARLLQPYAGRDDVVVLALPRGGVPVGYQVARALKAPLDVFIVRKLGVPGHEELAMGAIAGGGTIIRNQGVIDYLNISNREFQRVAVREQQELERREREYRNKRSPQPLEDRIVIMVDDGIATGATMQAAVAAVRQQRPKSVIIAAPVVAPEVSSRFSGLADAVLAIEEPGEFHAVGAWYEDFTQTTDEEVRAILQRAAISPRSWRLPDEPPHAIH